MNNEKLDRLTVNDTWIFTKQSVSFDTAFKAAKLFHEIENKEDVNISSYFSDNYERYGIEKDNYRVLVIPQFFGLLTKNPLYQRGGNYGKETTTEIFDMLNACEFGDKKYNRLKSEQILKIKIRAIIDTAKNNDGWCILPVIFSYVVLRTLKERYSINEISLDLFYTYVMSCSNYGEVEETVEYIRNNSPTSANLKKYKDRSRFLTLVQDNVKLFNITSTSISLNSDFDDYFYSNFIEKIDMDELNIQLSRDVDYTYFLTTYQGFDVNLIDQDEDRAKNIILADTSKARKKKVVKDTTGNIEDDDTDYVEKVDDVKEYNININIVQDAFKNKPSSVAVGILKRYSKNPLIGKVAINKVDYKCENNKLHETFISSHTRQQFMEAHHLIPINQQAIMWERYGVNIDCVENIISLCPNCHRAIHYAENETKHDLIEKLYNIKKNFLENIGLNISLDELFEIYGV